MGQRPSYDVILAATDFSPLSRAALRAAAELTGLLGSKRLDLLHVLTPTAIFGTPLGGIEVLPDVERDMLAEAKAHLDRIDLIVTSAEIQRQVVSGSIVAEIVRAAAEDGADLIVVGTHGRSAIGRFFLGSVASGLIRAASCPVLVIHEGHSAAKRFERIVAAVDLSRSSADILAHAGAFAEASQSRLQVLSVYEFPTVTSSEGPSKPRTLLLEPGEHRRAVMELVARSELPLGVESIAWSDRREPAVSILDHAELSKADLIIIGTSGHNALERAALGSTATKVVAQAKCPVLVVPVRRQRE